MRGLAGPATGISRTFFFLFFSLTSKYLFLHPKETSVKIVFSWVIQNNCNLDFGALATVLVGLLQNY